MAKKVIAMALAAALAVSIVGCTPSDTPKGGGTATTPVTGTSVDENGNRIIKDVNWEGMELTVAGYRKFNDDPLNYEFASGAEDFARDYGTAPVEFVVGGGDGMGDDLVAAITSGDPWDVQYTFGISVFPVPLAKDLYTPITNYLDMEDPYLTAATLEGAKWKGEYYGISNVGMQEVSYAVYNETWFKDLGVKTPHERMAEGTWTTDGYMEMVAELKQKGASVGMNAGRPNVVGKYLSKWTDDTVEVTYDSQENVDWLTMWSKLMADPAYQLAGGNVSTRGIIMMDEVFPNLIKGEITNETTDTLRYIHFPQTEDGSPATYLTDSHFLVPKGVAEEKIAAAVELSAYMCHAKDVIVNETYQANMSEEDYELLKENFANAYFLPRFYTPTLWGELQAKFSTDVNEGKPISTHISENLEWLKSQAAEFNTSYGN